MNRRDLLRTVTAVALQSHAIDRVRAATSAAGTRTPEEIATDEDYWSEIRNAFTVDRNVINLNNGYVSPSPRTVQDAMRRYLEYSDMGPYHTMVSVLERQVESVRRRLASAAGCDPEEIAITRNASESLENAQYGIDLKPGDEVLTTNQDYPRMIDTFAAARAPRRHRAQDRFRSPCRRPRMDDLYRRFEHAVTPRTKVILVCHITNRTGQIFPVQPHLPDGARARHPGDRGRRARLQPFPLQDLRPGLRLLRRQPAQVDCTRPSAQVSCTCASRSIATTWSLMARATALRTNDIRKFEEIGTHPAANHNAISEALIFNENIGIDRKAARLRYLRDRWANRLAQNPKCRILHSPDPAQSCGIGFLGLAPGVDGGKMRETLWNKYSIITTYMPHEAYSGLRITPNVYSTVRDIDTFSAAVEKELG